jgi:putative ABC transport system permease protein
MGRDKDHPFINCSIPCTEPHQKRTTHLHLVLLEFAAGIAMLISCIGLLGLVIFTLSSRTREISIRKVLGAPLFELMRLLSSGLVKLLLLAFAIAVPLAWLLCHAYLNSYAYHNRA